VTEYEKGSKLKSVKLEFRGILKRQDGSILRGLLVLSPFTMVSFWLLGTSFFVGGCTTLALAQKSPVVSKWVLRFALLSFECAAPTALLIAAVVKYYLWPMALESGSGNTAIYKDPRTLFEHNANVIMCLVEVGLLGGLPIRFGHFAVAPLWGIAYVYFCWWMSDKWCDKSAGPQFCYPFFDTTMGWVASVVLVVLLVVLTIFYALFALGAEYGLSQGLGTTLLSMLATLLLVCRFRD